MAEKSVPECPFAPLRPSFLVRDDSFFMKLAYNQALKAWASGEVPVGAVVEYGGEVVAQAYNMVESTADPTAHAEILAITQTAAKLGDWRLNGATLYVTKEPCPMCSGACVMARISRVVFAVKDTNMGFLGGAMKFHDLPTLNHSLSVSSGVLKEECLEMFKTFFALKRKMSADSSADSANSSSVDSNGADSSSVDCAFGLGGVSSSLKASIDRGYGSMQARRAGYPKKTPRDR